jgi:hypothetical protein
LNDDAGARDLEELDPFFEVASGAEGLPAGVRLRIAFDVLRALARETALVVRRSRASRLRVRAVNVDPDGYATVVGPGDSSGAAEILWEILAVREAPGSFVDSLSIAAPDVPLGVAEVVMRALEGEIASSADVADAFERASGRAIGTHADVREAFARAWEERWMRRAKIEAARRAEDGPISGESPVPSVRLAEDDEDDETLVKRPQRPSPPPRVGRPRSPPPPPPSIDDPKTPRRSSLESADNVVVFRVPSPKRNVLSPPEPPSQRDPETSGRMALARSPWSERGRKRSKRPGLLVLVGAIALVSIVVALIRMPSGDRPSEPALGAPPASQAAILPNDTRAEPTASASATVSVSAAAPVAKAPDPEPSKPSQSASGSSSSERASASDRRTKPGARQPNVRRSPSRAPARSLPPDPPSSPVAPATPSEYMPRGL